MRRTALAALIVLMGVAGPAFAAVTLETDNKHETFVPSGAAGEVVSRIPFSLDVRGYVYAKLLVTPWNAVNSGRANGTLSGGEGVSGWWISFAFTNTSGAAITSDALGRDVDPTNGPYVDSTPTPPILLEPEITYFLEARTHYPIDAATPGAAHRVVLALVFREEGTGEGAGSGGRLDQSRGFTESIRVPGTPTGDGPKTNSTGNSTGNQNTGNNQNTGQNPQLTAGPASPFALPAGTLGVMIVAGASLALLAVLVAAIAASLAAWAAVRALREVRDLKGGDGPPSDEQP